MCQNSASILFMLMLMMFTICVLLMLINKIQAAKEAADKAACTSGSVFDLSAGLSSHSDVELPADPSFCYDDNLSDGPSSRVAVDRSSRYARRFSGHDTVVADIFDVDIIAGPSSRPAVTRFARRTKRSSGPSAV
ncbi:hypothetical protein L1987_38466 [Smallanthus sonchifolius]|uniref:Uncharacterized protein n=1 Tax=Smallanthus sonchifolius TaxID=185202 RepID=A0ACB9HKM0_9ASTR|nr:hypothetical protein L1987_38466 [Smallanthus sonchifolius]